MSSNHPVVTHENWLEARRELLAREKEFTRLRDELSRQRRELPWEKVEKDYVFDGHDGPETLAGLFAGKRQLIVYHFMFGPDWEQGCSHCSFWADNFDGIVVHLKQRCYPARHFARAAGEIAGLPPAHGLELPLAVFGQHGF